jgi:hypothetical protein
MLKCVPMTSLISYDVIKLVHFCQKTSLLKSDLSPFDEAFSRHDGGKSGGTLESG